MYQNKNNKLITLYSSEIAQVCGGENDAESSTGRVLSFAGLVGLGVTFYLFGYCFDNKEEWYCKNNILGWTWGGSVGTLALGLSCIFNNDPNCHNKQY